MADVFVNWVASLNAIFGSGVSSFMVKASGDVAYYSLGAARDTKIEITDLNKPDSILRLLGWGYRVEATLPSLQCSETEIKILDQLILKQMLSVRIGFNNGLYLVTDKLGLKWTLRSDGDFSDFIMIDYLFGCNYPNDEVGGLITDTPPAIGTPNVADVLFTLAQTNVSSHQVGNGLSKFEFQANGDGAFVSFDFQKGIFTVECVGEDGGGGRQQFRTTALKATLSAEGFETDLPKLALLGAFNQNQINVKVTRMNGDVWTLSGDRFGLIPKVMIDGNIDKVARIVLNGEGSFPKTATAFTGWDASWT